MEKKKYKVVLDRPACIGSFACAAVLPERWQVNPDGKVDLIKGKQENGNFVLEVELTAEDLEKELESAKVCPVNVIHVFDETGKKLI